MLSHELFSLLIILTVTSAQDGSVGRRVPNFIGTRGKKNDMDTEKEIPIIDFEPVSKLEDSSDEARYSMTKRAQFGFQGTRGKKMSEISYKRALGFTGTRGKKYDSYFYPKAVDVDDYWLLRNELAKRKFYGMRGKKLPYSFNLMGVRGKKGPSTSAFFGTRGKKDDTLAVNKDDSSSAENIATMMYLLAADKDYTKHHSNDDSDFEISDFDLLSQDQQSSSSDGSTV